MRYPLFRDKEFIRSLITISVPIALQNLISFGLSMMDTVMLGSLGEKQISASAIANQPFFIFTVFMFGLASGACVLTAQYWGKGDTGAVSRILSLAIRASVLCSLLFGAVVLIFSQGVIELYTKDREVIELGAQFLRIIGFSYILSAVSTTYLFIMRSVENVTVPLAINFVSFAVNILLNWILIFGRCGLPAMGIRGAATATLIARVVEFVLAVLYALFIDRKVRIRLSDFLTVDRLLLKDFIRYSMPVVVNETLWALGTSMQSVIIGHISSEAVAASSIAGVVQRLSTVVIMGVANFTAVAVGKQIGAGNFEKAGQYASGMLRLSVVLGVFASVFLLAIRDPFLSFYSIDQVTADYARSLMAVYAFSTFFACINMTNIIGVLRGGGDTHYAMYTDILTMWLVAVPAGAVASLVLHLPLPFVLLMLVLDEPVKIIVGMPRYLSGRWKRNVTR